MIRMSLAGLAVLLVVALMVGCSSDGPSSSEEEEDLSSLEGWWEGMVFENGGDSVAWVELRFDANGNVVEGSATSGINSANVVSGTISASGGLNVTFESGGVLRASSITIAANTITGGGYFTPPGGSRVSVSFELTRMAP